MSRTRLQERKRYDLKKQVFFLLFVYLWALALPALSEEASLPLSFTPGPVPRENCYIGDYEYQDPSIHVVIEEGTAFDCDYWLARIKVADASQIRTAAPDNFKYGTTTKVEALAKNNNAVLAINGDYWSYKDYGFFVRQGKLLLNWLYAPHHPDEKKRDILMIDEDGDFHVFYSPLRGDLDYLVLEDRVELDGKQIYNAFWFGPVLVDGGEVAPLTATGEWMAPDDRKQRACIAQVGPLEYMCLCCVKKPTNHDNPGGITLADFAQLAKDLGAQIAYNLDGGDSTSLIFHNTRLNNAQGNNPRDISDIIYFATLCQ